MPRKLWHSEELAPRAACFCPKKKGTKQNGNYVTEIKKLVFCILKYFVGREEKKENQLKFV